MPIRSDNHLRQLAGLFAAALELFVAAASGNATVAWPAWTLAALT